MAQLYAPSLQQCSMASKRVALRLKKHPNARVFELFETKLYSLAWQTEAQNTVRGSCFGVCLLGNSNTGTHAPLYKNEYCAISAKFDSK